MLHSGWNVRTTALTQMSGTEERKQAGQDDAAERIADNRGSIAAFRSW